MRKENAKFDTKFISEAGSYLVNSDYFAFVELKDYACYVVADGIDSDEKKEMETNDRHLLSFPQNMCPFHVISELQVFYFTFNKITIGFLIVIFYRKRITKNIQNSIITF